MFYHMATVFLLSKYVKLAWSTSARTVLYQRWSCRLSAKKWQECINGSWEKKFLSASNSVEGSCLLASVTMNLDTLWNFQFPQQKVFAKISHVSKVDCLIWFSVVALAFTMLSHTTFICRKIIQTFHQSFQDFVQSKILYTTDCGYLWSLEDDS